MKPVKESERLFAVQKELRQALCLQADNGICLVYELYPWHSHEQSRIYRFKVNKKDTMKVSFLFTQNQRFELWNRVTGYTISNRAPSTS